MKVLHVVATGQRRGGEIFASDLTRYLKTRGVDQRVLMLRASHLDVDFGVPTRAAAGDGSRFPVSPAALRALRTVLSGWRPDVIQAHGGEPLKHVVLSGAATDAPVVYRRIGGLSLPLKSSRVRRRLYAELMARARRVITVAEALRGETIAQFRLPEERVVTIPNGVDPRRLVASASRADVRGAMGVGPGDKLLLSVAALVQEKDPQAYVDTAAMIVERDPQVVYAVAGDGPMRERLERQVARQGWSARCRFLGRRSDVGDLMGASDALLFAGHWLEGMPGVLIEAAMVGLPVVAFDVAGVSEVVRDGESGTLVPWGEVHGLAEATLRLFADPALATRLAANARRSASRFEIEQVGDRYLDLYEASIT